jgi:hypothetical protein
MVKHGMQHFSGPICPFTYGPRKPLGRWRNTHPQLNDSTDMQKLLVSPDVKDQIVGLRMAGSSIAVVSRDQGPSRLEVIDARPATCPNVSTAIVA